MLDAKDTEINLPEVADKTKELSLMSGIMPSDFGELTRFADLVFKSHLSPKGFDTVEKVAIGILTNMELGRPIITGMQDLAIINGRCGIYGDASLAMVTASGLMDEGYPKSEETGTPYTDDWKFTFTVKRIGRPEETGVWTWIDSKRAGFDNPKQRDGKPDIYSPWKRFTRRMMQWKSRNFVMRDNFGDVLKGMKTVEDLHDLDAIPLTKGLSDTYSAEPAASDLTAAIKEKVSKKNVDEKEKKGEKPSATEKTEPEKDETKKTEGVSKKEVKEKEQPKPKPLSAAQGKKIIVLGAERDLTDDETRKVIDWYAENNKHGGRTFEAGEALIHGFDTIFERFLDEMEKTQGGTQDGEDLA